MKITVLNTLSPVIHIVVATDRAQYYGRFPDNSSFFGELATLESGLPHVLEGRAVVLSVLKEGGNVSRWQTATITSIYEREVDQWAVAASIDPIDVINDMAGHYPMIRVVLAYATTCDQVVKGRQELDAIRQRVLDARK